MFAPCFAVPTDNRDTQGDKASPPFPFAMSSDGNNDVSIPSVFIAGSSGEYLRTLMGEGKVQVLLTSPSLHPERKKEQGQPPHGETCQSFSAQERLPSKDEADQRACAGPDVNVPSERTFSAKEETHVKEKDTGSGSQDTGGGLGDGDSDDGGRSTAAETMYDSGSDNDQSTVAQETLSSSSSSSP